ncbi:MAG: type II toxin-antitoxin system RelE family toxin [Chitinophagales bacterium]|jgi:mRNA interferase RelE/StbE|nr:type II toxin-antitoxin system RelE/ParE family toxin [Sphingobacteriales bacterium]
MYSISFTKKALKALISINEPHYSSIKSAIENLAENPRPSGCVKLKGLESYRIRVGDYRIIYHYCPTKIIKG